MGKMISRGGKAAKAKPDEAGSAKPVDAPRENVEEIATDEAQPRRLRKSERDKVSDEKENPVAEEKERMTEEEENKFAQESHIKSDSMDELKAQLERARLAQPVYDISDGEQPVDDEDDVLLAQEPAEKSKGGSEILRWIDGNDRECVLFLGDKRDSIAALTPGVANEGVKFSNVICVGNNRTAQTCSRHASKQTGGAKFESFWMADRMRAGDVVDIEFAGDKALPAVAKAVGKVKKILPASTKSVKEVRGVLVHCDMGINRSPTIVMTTLISEFGMTLRQAYKCVLSSRPGINPIPPYRESVSAYELKKTGKSTVKRDEEPFAMHFSELMCKFPDGDGFRIQDQSIAQLLAED